MKVYPSMRYHPTKDPVKVHSEAHDDALGADWFHSPADFGVETCPGKTPDPIIAAKKLAHEKAKNIDTPASQPKRASQARAKA